MYIYMYIYIYIYNIYYIKSYIYIYVYLYVCIYIHLYIYICFHFYEVENIFFIPLYFFLFPGTGKCFTNPFYCHEMEKP